MIFFKSQTPSPLEYSERKFLVYFELHPYSKREVMNIIDIFLGEENFVADIEYGLIYNMQIQLIPEIIKEIQDQNHAIYGIVPYYIFKRKLLGYFRYFFSLQNIFGSSV